MQYRRILSNDATYFLTVVAYNRQHLFKTPEIIQLLRQDFYDDTDFPPAGDWLKPTLAAIALMCIGANNLPKDFTKKSRRFSNSDFGSTRFEMNKILNGILIIFITIQSVMG